MANPTEYIVFKPDQVLTNDHLNETFDYLDQQNRWTRNKLIGIGIVCGLDIVLNPGMIEITQGCGVTSQGYLIIQDTTDYTYYMPYAPVDVPLDPPFQYPVAYGNLPFFKPFCAAAKQPIYLLITDGQHDALDDKSSALTISSATTSFLNDYAVVLFLEANETDLKNCDMQDCNNKGERMSFQVRPLLVAKADLPTANNQTAGGTNPQGNNVNLPHEINFKRYNVPYNDLKNTDDVLNAFVNIVDDATLTQVSNAYNYCYSKYNSLLKVSANPFNGLLAILQKYRDQILSQNPIFIEYFYDFIDDLIKAYYEFSVKVSSIISTCCPDENLFPLHLVLGGASQATSSLVTDNYRTYFIYSPLFSKMGTQSAELKLLFNRMVIMTEQFNVQVQQGLQLQGFSNQQLPAIVITPSQYELPWLSERAIPYYYNVNVSGSELYKAWSYYKTSHGSAGFNLGYNAHFYNSNTAVTQPLLYDIEHYNFFRVEGHIGLNYQTVLTDILNKRQKYNLPFDVVPISADLLTSDAVLPECNFQDLETDYNLIIGEAACKIHLNFCFIATNMPYTPINQPGILEGKINIPTQENPVSFSAFKLNALSIPEAVALVDLAYQKGDFMRKYCPPPPNTIGSAYLNILSSGPFINPVPIPVNNDSFNPLIVMYHYFFEFIDAVEELMYVLNTSTVASIHMAAFGLKYQAYLVDTFWTMASLVALSEAKATKDQTNTFVEAYELGVLAEEFGVLTSICIDERLQVLKDEYNRRLTQYQQQHTFLNYYKAHPGLEHKAGVPKGGTLVLVYHSDTPSTSTATGVVFLARQQSTDQNMLSQSATFDTEQIRLIKSFVNDCQSAPADKKQKIIDILVKRPISQPKYQVTDGVVIADFYIPYLCCSDCPPVAYIMPPAQDVPTIKMGKVFCVNDTSPEPIVVPPGGHFNIDKVPGIDDVKQTFTPHTAGANTYDIIYTLNNVPSLPFTVTVLDVPDSDFSVTSVINPTNGELSLTFTPVSLGADFSYNWVFDKVTLPPQSSNTDPIPVITLKWDGQQFRFLTSLLVSVSGLDCGLKPVEKNFTIDPNGGIHEIVPGGSGILGGIEKLFTKKKK